MQSKFILYITIFISLAVSLYLMATQSIRLDESQSIWFATKPVDTLLNIMGQDVNTFLYILILHFWIQILGTQIFVVRLLSWIFFLISIPILYRLVKESSTTEVAITTVCIYCLSPFVLWYSAEARTYTLFILATILSHLYFLRMMRSSLKEGKLGYLLSSILGLYTHYFFVFLLFTQGLYFLIHHLRDDLKQKSINVPNIIKSILSRNMLTFISLILLTFFSLVPWLAYVYSLGSASNMKPMIAKPTSYNLFQTFINFLFGFQNSTIQNALISFWPLIIIFIFLVFTIRRSIRIQYLDYLGIMTLVPVFIMFAVSFIQPIFLSRYMIFVTPTLYFLLAWVLINVSKKVTSVVAIVFLIIMFGFSLYQVVSAESPIKEDYVDVTRYISKSATPQDIVLVTSPFTIYPVEYSYTGKTRIETVPLWKRYSAGSIPPFSQENFQEQLKKYKDRYNYMYIIFSYDQGYEKQIKNYLDKHYERKDLKKFAETIELRVYKLRYRE